MWVCTVSLGYIRSCSVHIQICASLLIDLHLLPTPESFWGYVNNLRAPCSCTVCMTDYARLTFMQCTGPWSAWAPTPTQSAPCSLPPSLLLSSMQGKCSPVKSVVAIFRINTLTPTLRVGFDANQVYRLSREMGKERKGFRVWESRSV